MLAKSLQKRYIRREMNLDTQMADSWEECTALPTTGQDAPPRYEAAASGDAIYLTNDTSRHTAISKVLATPGPAQRAYAARIASLRRHK